MKPTDWKENPKFIDFIQDQNFKSLAVMMNDIWKNLTRRISKSRNEIEQKSSLIYLEHPFVVPGGRYKSFWIECFENKQVGLFLCHSLIYLQGELTKKISYIG